MPEGPSIVILKEAVQSFSGKKVLSVSGNSKQDIQRASGKRVAAFNSWGKHFLICFTGFSIRLHFLLFGSYRINEVRDTEPRLSLQFSNGSIDFYACSVKIIDGDIGNQYDWSADIMSDTWNEKAAIKKLKTQPGTLVCDALLDQDIFAGSGNIIKNEVLFRIRVHPASLTGSLPDKKQKELVRETRNYAFDFLRWKKAFVLKKHWLAHTKKTCARCNMPLIKEYLGKTRRRTFYCSNCQELYR